MNAILIIFKKGITIGGGIDCQLLTIATSDCCIHASQNASLHYLQETDHGSSEQPVLIFFLVTSFSRLVDAVVQPQDRKLGERHTYSLQPHLRSYQLSFLNLAADEPGWVSHCSLVRQ
jgi:hypothetical protein